MDKAVIIRFQIRNLLEDYAKIGNFLRKYETHAVYTEDELVRVSRAWVDRAQRAYDFLTADYKDIRVVQAASLQKHLVENIVHYTQGGIGALSLRRYEPKNFKLFLGGRGIRQFPAKDCTYLEFEIADYSPLEGTGNLAETFKRGLSEDARGPFRSITPVDFFMIGSDSPDGPRELELKDAWHNYRSSGENFT